MLNVLHVHSGNLYGGVETFLLTLARCREMSPSVQMSAALCFEGRIASEFRDENIPTTMLGEVRLRRPDSVWRARQALAAILNEGRFDAVICHQAWPLAIFGSVVKTAGLPLIEWLHMAQTGSHWLDRLASRVQPDCYICNSDFTASVLPKTAARVETIYPPVMPKQPNKGGRSRNMVRDEFETRADDVVVIQVSRMEPLKGQSDCIAALAGLRDQPGWVCWQVGGAQRAADAKYMESLRRDVERHGLSERVRFLGERSDVGDLLSAADLFCQPNRAPDAFGISFVEALSAGLPVVTTSIGGAREIVDSTCGILVQPDDHEALSAALSRLILARTEREELGRLGPRRAAFLCDPATQMAKIAATLQSVCSRYEALQ